MYFWTQRHVLTLRIKFKSRAKLTEKTDCSYEMSRESTAEPLCAVFTFLEHDLQSFRW